METARDPRNYLSRPVPTLRLRGSGDPARDGSKLLETEDPLWGAALPEPDRRWTWDIAPRPEIARDVDVRYAMVVYVDFGRESNTIRAAP